MSRVQPLQLSSVQCEQPEYQKLCDADSVNDSTPLTMPPPEWPLVDEEEDSCGYQSHDTAAYGSRGSSEGDNGTQTWPLGRPQVSERAAAMVNGKVLEPSLWRISSSPVEKDALPSIGSQLSSLWRVSSDPVEKDALPSIGSQLHATGQCRPCGFFWKPGGCINGKACEHCHLCPWDEIKRRKKVKRTAQEAQKGSTDDSSMEVQPEEPQELSDTEIIAPFPSSLGGAAEPAQKPMSLGSLLHDGTGQSKCKPCGWFYKKGGCKNGWECLHCHICPPTELKVRKMKSALRRESGHKTQLQTQLQKVTSENARLREQLFSERVDNIMKSLDLSCLASMQGHEMDLEDRMAHSMDLSYPSTIEGRQAELVDNMATPSFPPGLFLPMPMPPVPMPPVPLMPPPMPSKGSALHAQGLCKPCGFFFKSKGCKNGLDCEHCHLCDLSAHKLRKKKEKNDSA